MNIEVKDILERRITSIKKEIEFYDRHKCDDSRYFYYRGIIEELKSIYIELFGEVELFKFSESLKNEN